MAGIAPRVAAAAARPFRRAGVPWEGGALPAHAIRPEAVARYLAGSKITTEPIFHGTSPKGARSIVRHGVLLQHGGKRAFGRGFYTSVRAEEYFGNALVRVAVPNRKPLQIRWSEGGIPWLLMRKIGAATGVDLLRETRGRSKFEKYEAARQALLGAGYDSVAVKTPGLRRNQWLVALDPNTVRVVADKDTLPLIREEQAKNAALEAFTSVRLGNVSVLVNHDQLTHVAREIAASPHPVSWQVRHLDDAQITSSLLRRRRAPRDLYLYDRHTTSRTHALSKGDTSGVLRMLNRAGAETVPYGAGDDFLHGKLIAGTNAQGQPVALVRTNTDQPAAARQANLGVLLKGRPAVLAQRIIRATADGDKRALAAAAAEARVHGLLLHDAHNGVDELRPVIARMIAQAPARDRPLTIIEKELTDPRIARQLATAHAHGSAVRIAVGKIDSQSAEILQEAGVPFSVHDGWLWTVPQALQLVKLHRAGVPVDARPVHLGFVAKQILKRGGVPITDKPFPHLNVFSDGSQTVVASFHHMPNMVDLRQSQEIGVLLSDRPARQAIEAALLLVQPPV